MANDELVFVQGPVMTAAHVYAMERVDALWLFPDEFERKLIGEVLRHVEVVVAMAAEGTRMVRITRTVKAEPLIVAPDAAMHFDDWRVEYRAPTVEECYDCDQ